MSLNVLVATSVVEVGIDVPNATVMLVEGANHFGSGAASPVPAAGWGVASTNPTACCCLIPIRKTGRERLQAIEATQDGFELAEKDLDMRGPGEFFGTRQSGLPLLKLAELGDVATLTEAREAARALCEQDCELTQPEHQLLAQKLQGILELEQRSELSYDDLSPASPLRRERRTTGLAPLPSQGRGGREVLFNHIIWEVLLQCR